MTVPGVWEHLLPTAAVARARLKAFHARLNRALGRIYAIVAREFPAAPRSAPHWHICLPLPQTIGDLGTAEWLGRAWADVIGSDCKHHRVQGTHVSWGFGARSVDPVRIARYFSGYSTKGAKDYQFVPPSIWLEQDGSIGRAWTIWGLKRAEASLFLSEQEFIEVRRLLRRIDRAKRRTRVVTVRRIDRRTGEIKHRRVNRRADTKSLNQSRLVGGSLFTPDGPRLTHDVRRFIQSIQPTESETK